MNLSGKICYLQKPFFLRTSKIFPLNLDQLYSTLGVKFKDLSNSSDFSQLSVIFQNFTQFYRLKENASVEKKTFLISIENCILLEEELLKESFHKKIKNFSYWCFKQWITEKESYGNFYFFTFFTFLLFQINPSNYYFDSYLSSKLKKEKTETWVILVTIEIFSLLDNFKEVCWNFISNSWLKLKKLNKDILFNFLSKIETIFRQNHWKFFYDVLTNTDIVKGNLILSITSLFQLKINKIYDKNF
jgi:hypothetical protein